MGMGIRGEAVRQLQALLDSGPIGALDDGELLRRFLGRDPSAESAFAALVARHGRMVHRVCLDVLGDPHDAQDAAQATFLVLARRAATIARPEALAAWLHGTARRIAGRTLRDAIRRRKHERKGLEAAARSPGPARDWSELHEEIDRLPARYREPIVLCDLAGLSHDQAASQLGAPLRTLQTRLYRGREQLKGRLIRRGVAPSAALVGSAWAAEARASTPLAWAAGASAGGPFHPGAAATLARAYLKEMLMAKLTVIAAVGLLAGAAAGGGWSFGSAEGPAAGQDRPVALPSPAPGPPDDFEKAYILADGEDVKALQGDAITARDRHYEDDPNLKRMGEVNVFGWAVKSPRWKMSMFGSGEGAELTSTLTAVLEIKAQEVEGDLALLRTPIRADFLDRDGVSAEKLVPQLDAILRRDFKLPIRLALRAEARDVITVGGQYRYKPDPASRPNEFPVVLDHIEVYAREVADLQSRPRPHTVSGSDLDGFLSELGQHFGVRFLNDVKVVDGPKRQLGWRISGYRFPETAPVDDQGPTLDHVAEQTGLTFAKARREVRILQVDRVE